MIYDIITFVVSKQKFAIDLQKVPIILTATEYLPNNFTFLNDSYYFEFNNMETELINLTNLLNLNNCTVQENTKILVGQNGGGMFGFLVDEVKEIVNINGEKEVNFFEHNGSEKDYILGELEIFNEKLKVIDVNKILKKRYENQKPLL